MYGVDFHREGILMTIVNLPKRMSRATGLFRKTYRILGSKAGLFYRPGPDDVYLVSYPRSGNSWLRQAVAEMIFGESGDQYNEIHRYVPTVDMSMPFWRVKSAPFRAVKSHESCVMNERTDGYRRVIYIIRDPRDVVVSHHRFEKQLGKYTGDLDAFIKDWVYGRVWPGSWATHVASWTLERDLARRDDMLVITYEEMHTKTLKTFGRVAGFLGLELNESDLEEVIRRTSVQRMQKKEDRSAGKVAGFRSVNAGGTRKWERLLSPDQAQLVLDHFGAVMEHYEYV
jgi:estrone sulfotransferase